MHNSSLLTSQAHDGNAPGCPQRWRVVAASVRGDGHEKAGQLCQDAHFWQALPGEAAGDSGVLLAAVADGAGSAPLAEVGSSIAARAAVQALCASALPPRDGNDECWKAWLAAALRAARAAVEEEARSRQVEAGEMATTLIVAAVAGELVAAAQVGDGAVVVGDAEGSITALTAPQSGEYINETTFLTSPNALESAQAVVRRQWATRLAVFSDGLQMLALAMPEGTPHEPFFAPLFRFAAGARDEQAAGERLAQFLSSPLIRERTHDDVTLLLASLR